MAKQKIEIITCTKDKLIETIKKILEDGKEIIHEENASHGAPIEWDFAFFVKKPND